ncbi:hypothetical protein Pmani_010600 [Petrolisthes manimaculis]|uniref:Uncharacterized protein n=1 Tax=Petrolisthes manimaculis TaxID=1843537 RepID=A0AAE1Q159_9EUCA|nr:hypothetical protein Pmani_010600 [Petrolisthes manimaculis]
MGGDGMGASGGKGQYGREVKGCGGTVWKGWECGGTVREGVGWQDEVALCGKGWGGTVWKAWDGTVKEGKGKGR